MGTDNDPSAIQSENQQQPVSNDEQTIEAAEDLSSEEAVPQITQEQLEEAEKKAQNHWDKLVRIQAEMDNLRKRTQKDLENAHKFALEGFAKELLTVIDSLELGIKAASGDSAEVTKFREGSELTLNQFTAAFEKFKIDVLEPVGQPFNPELHQAISMQPTADFLPNTVMACIQKGYVLNGRLLRPAMVIVAKGMEGTPQDTPKIDEQA